MSLLVILAIVWSVVTSALVLLIIYRSVVGMREDDQLFLNQAEAQSERDQREILAKLKRTLPYVKYLGATSGLLLAIIAGLWVYQGLTSNPMP